MGKPMVVFEWQKLHEQQELPPEGRNPGAGILTQLPPAGPGKKRQTRVLIGGAICLLLLALLGATWIQRQAQAGLAEIQNELMLAVDAEAWQTGSGQSQAITPASAGAASSALTKVAGAPQGQEQVRSVTVQALRQDVAAIMVVSEARPEDARARHAPITVYRQLRFYRQTDAGWQPTEPAPSLWGQLQHLATEHFDFTYRSRDAQAVQAVAAELDALYTEIRSNLGLPTMLEHKIQIIVMVGNVSDRQKKSAMRAGQVVVSSPALLAAPETLTDTAILRQSILLDLVDMVIEEAVSTHEVSPRWYPLLSAMRLWLIWDLEGPLATWREPVLRWLYMDLPLMDADSAPPLPAKYAELCALYSVWEIAPIHTGIPLFCSQLDHQTAWHMVFLPSHHQAYNEETYLHEQIYARGRFGSVLTASLLDYIAATYGRAQVRTIWLILHEHHEWETLIPAVFGVPVAEFEAGRQAYMVAYYGQSVSQEP